MIQRGSAMRYWMRKLTKILLLLAGLSLLCLFLFRVRYNQVIKDLAKTQVVNATSDLINDAVATQISTGDVAYDKIVYFEKDVNGRITALKTNIGEVNRLKTDTLNVINDEIFDIEQTDLGIPLGSFFLPEFLSGRGPQIPVKILSSSAQMQVLPFRLFPGHVPRFLPFRSQVLRPEDSPLKVSFRLTRAREKNSLKESRKRTERSYSTKLPTS